MGEPLKLPPHSHDAECAVLGGLLFDNNAYDRIAFLRAGDFYSSGHETIFVCIKALLDAGRPCDVVLLAELLSARGELERCGGPGYLGALYANTPGAANIRNYATIVQRHAKARALQALSVDLHAAAASGAHDPVALAEETASKVLAIIEGDSRGDFVHISQAVGDAVDWLDDPVKGISTGYPCSLDPILGGGFRPADLIVIAGRPSMGKTALAHNICEHVSKNEPVAFFSLEMTARSLGVRSVRWHEHLSDRTQAIRHLYQHKLWIDDNAQLTVGSLRVRLQRIKRKHGLALVAVDYVQLATGEGQNRTQEIGSLSRGFKALAKEFNVPFLVVSQLNRSVEARQDKRPLLSDLRESGELEQDADVVLMVYRDEYYAPDSHAKGFAEVLVRKQRDGETGTAWMLFDGAYTRFKDFSGPPPRVPQSESQPRGFRPAVVRDFKNEAAGDR